MSIYVSNPMTEIGKIKTYFQEYPLIDDDNTPLLDEDEAELLGVDNDLIYQVWVSLKEYLLYNDDGICLTDDDGEVLYDNEMYPLHLVFQYNE